MRRALSRNLKPSSAPPASSAGGGGAAAGRAAGGATASSSNGERGAGDGSAKERELVQRILRTKDYYELLGVTRQATDDEIKKA